MKYSKFSIYHQYVLIVKKRNEFIKYLKKAKIQYGFHYPKSINQLAIFKKTFSKNKFANAEKLAKKGISLPIDPNLEIKQVKKIVKLINSI